LDQTYKLTDDTGIDSPALLVYPSKIKANIEKAIAFANGVSRLRPHAKTHKTPDVARLQLEAGINKFKCSTIAEAEMLAMTGAKDILLAYQPTSVKATRLLELCHTYPDVSFSCLIDNENSARVISDIFAERTLDIYIDLNVGMNRTGTKPENAQDLYLMVKTLPALRIKGLHAYDGHIHDRDPVIRKQKAESILSQVEELRESLEMEHKETVKIVMGGSPCFPFYAEARDVETSPGTFVFWDQGYTEMLPDLDFDLAAMLLVRVISVVNSTTICLDLGHKSVAAENPLPRVYFPEHPEVRVISQSEEHLVVEVTDSTEYNPGDIWYGVPYHICPTVALYETLHVVEDHAVVARWEVIARDRMISI
jgi:D-serine deaminase-like pyridoxal phosphate-dependent protein